MIQTTARTAAIIPLRPDLALTSAAAPITEHAPKVFTPNFIERLAALNEALRWLRSSGYTPVAVHLQYHLPTIQVDAQAAPLLITEAHGFNAHRIDAEHRHYNVILKGCSICWIERIPAPTLSTN